MANASLSEIYNRMHNVGSYHPFTADTYADWSLEAGDIVTVERNGERLVSPVHTATVRWNGSQRVTLESRGEKKREPIAKMSARAFNSGGSGYRSGYGRSVADKDRDTRISKNEEAITLEAWDRKNADNTFDTALTVQAKAITAEVNNRKKDGELIRGEIKVEADRINQMVKAVGANGEITAASITLAINKAGSSARINADNIILDGTTTLNSIMSVDGQAVRIKRRLVVGNGASMTQIYPSFISTPSVLCNNAAMKVADATVSGNTLTITYCDGRSPQTFSKATSLSGAWSGGNTWTVTASPQGNTDVIRIGQKDKNTIGIARVGAETWLGTFEHGQWDAGWAQGFSDGQGSYSSYRMYKAFNTNDTIYYGRLYNSAGVALTNSSYYWFGCSTNLGGTAASVNVKY